MGTLAQLGIKLFRGQNHPHKMEYVVWIGGLLLTFLVTTALARLALKMMADVERAAEKPVSLAQKPRAGSDKKRGKREPAIAEN
jgi:hypothetical protein